jgi:ketosteroid isomerase-like protein
MGREGDLRSMVEDWIEAWNCKDLDRIMLHYASSIVFEANTVVRRWNRPDGVLRGADELREHFRMGLEKAPTLHFELEEVFTAPSGYAALYRRDNGNRVLDVVELDSSSLAVAVKAFYLGSQA